MKISVAIKLTMCIALMTGSYSCKNLLEEVNPSGTTAEVVYTTPEGFESLVAAAYSYNRYWYGKEEGMGLSEMGTDLWTLGEQGQNATSGQSGDNIPLVTYNNLNPVNGNLTRVWKHMYIAVNLCNAGIKIEADGGDFNPDDKIVAELKFLRAWYYWHIVETWGGVHFTTEPTTEAIQTANRTPVATFYTQIIQDLNDAIAALPVTSSEYGRVNQRVAKAFLARVYLTRGWMNNDNADFTAARDLAVDVINNGGYTLVPNYEHLWAMDVAKQHNTEVIWSVNYAADLSISDVYDANTNPYGFGLDILSAGGNPTNGRGNQVLHTLFIPRYDVTDEVNAAASFDNLAILDRTTRYGRPFNRFMPTKFLLDLYDKTNDERYKGSFQTVWKVNKALTSGLLVGKVINVDTAMVIDQSLAASANYYTYDVNSNYDLDGSSVSFGNNQLYPSLKKFQDSTRSTSPDDIAPAANNIQSAKDVYVIRLAEMYLIAAEAEVQIANTAAAAGYVNTLRDRAEIVPGGLDVTSGDMDIDFILDERAREFAGENTRWFDLKRTDMLQARIAAYNLDITDYDNSIHKVRPIPQVQIDVVTNKGEFFQNTGY